MLEAGFGPRKGYFIAEYCELACTSINAEVWVEGELLARFLLECMGFEM